MSLHQLFPVSYRGNGQVCSLGVEAIPCEFEVAQDQDSSITMKCSTSWLELEEGQRLARTCDLETMASSVATVTGTVDYGLGKLNAEGYVVDLSLSERYDLGRSRIECTLFLGKVTVQYPRGENCQPKRIRLAVTNIPVSWWARGGPKVYRSKDTADLVFALNSQIPGGTASIAISVHDSDVASALKKGSALCSVLSIAAGTSVEWVGCEI